MQEATQAPDIKMDAEGICREEVFTDNRIGTIRKLTPVTANGDDDAQRQVQFIGSTQIMTPGGALPLNFEIPADSLAQAIEGFGDAAKQAVEQTMEELKDGDSLQRIAKVRNLIRLSKRMNARKAGRNNSQIKVSPLHRCTSTIGGEGRQAGHESPYAKTGIVNNVYF